MIQIEVIVLYIQGVPQKMSPIIFGGVTSLYLIKGSIFLQWVEKQSYIKVTGDPTRRFREIYHYSANFYPISLKFSPNIVR